LIDESKESKIKKGKVKGKKQLNIEKTEIDDFPKLDMTFGKQTKKAVL